MDEYGLTKELYSNHRVIQRMEPVVRLSNDQNEVQEAKNKIEELIGRNQQIRTDIVALNSNVGARLATSFLIEQFNNLLKGREGTAMLCSLLKTKRAVQDQCYTIRSLRDCIGLSKENKLAFLTLS